MTSGAKEKHRFRKAKRFIDRFAVPCIILLQMMKEALIKDDFSAKEKHRFRKAVSPRTN